MAAAVPPIPPVTGRSTIQVSRQLFKKSKVAIIQSKLPFLGDCCRREAAVLTPKPGLDEGAMDSKPVFTEHHVSRDRGSLYARDYDGTSPAFVLMHGFPDNLRIYDDLIPYLVAGRRRAI